MINAGLITEEEVSRLNTFAGVKGELLANDRIKYTVQYINVSADHYTNEELYNMIQDVSNSNSEGSSIIEDVKDKINSNTDAIQNNKNAIQNNTSAIAGLTDKTNNSNIFLQMYPVGSVYVNSTNTNPSTMFGGTWELVDKRFSDLNGVYSTTSNTNVNMFTPTTSLSDYSIAVIRSEKTIRIRAGLTPAIELNDSTYELGTLNFSNLGISSLIYTFNQLPCTSDGGNGIAYISVNNSTGVFTVYDVITKTSGGTIPSGKTIYCDFTITARTSVMLDSASGEFHFKRTA